MHSEAECTAEPITWRSRPACPLLLHRAGRSNLPPAHNFRAQWILLGSFIPWGREIQECALDFATH